MGGGAGLLDLPFELHCKIVGQLPFSSQILYQTQICRPLRSLFDGRLCLRRPDVFRLVDWRRASSEVARLLKRDEAESVKQRNAQQCADHDASPVQRRSIWDISPSSTPKPAPAPAATLPAPALPISLPILKASVPYHLQQRCADQSNAPSERNGSIPFADNPDVDLFVRCMRLLGKMDVQHTLAHARSSCLPPLRSATTSTATPLHVLSLLSRTGFRVAALTHLLHSFPTLHYVETVLMTSAGFTESLLWTVFIPASDGAGWPAPLSDPDRHAGPAADVACCIETQAIVVPGPQAQRGHGLRSGFKCLCFAPCYGEKQAANAAASLMPSASIIEDPPIFHVVLHDWYDEAEAEGTQDMLEHSEITCNACKRSILF